MKELIGHLVKEIWLSPEADELCFVLAAGQYHDERFKLTYKTWGDCCSDSWFQDIVGVEAILDETIESVEDIEDAALPPARQRDPEETHVECKMYGVKLKSNMGVCDIIYRNESNGYYGGWHKLTESPSDEQLKSWFPIRLDLG